MDKTPFNIIQVMIWVIITGFVALYLIACIIGIFISGWKDVVKWIIDTDSMLYLMIYFIWTNQIANKK